MGHSPKVRQELRRLRAQLVHCSPTWKQRHQIDTWVARVRPFLRRHFAVDYNDFDKLAQSPRFYVILGSSQDRQKEQQELRDNNERAANAKARLVAFFDTLLQLIDDPTPNPAQQ